MADYTRAPGGSTTGATCASLHPDLVIISDDAGQFNVLIHALCWIHAERGIHTLVGFTEAQRTALAWARGELWAIYRALKAYKAGPSAKARSAIEARFEQLCAPKTCFESLHRALMRLHRNGAELLRALDRPEIALPNNSAERDIRDYVKKRKNSGSTRSAAAANPSPVSRRPAASTVSRFGPICATGSAARIQSRGCRARSSGLTVSVRRLIAPILRSAPEAERDRGRHFSPTEITATCRTIAAHPEVLRARCRIGVCEHLDWRRLGEG